MCCLSHHERVATHRIDVTTENRWVPAQLHRWCPQEKPLQRQGVAATHFRKVPLRLASAIARTWDGRMDSMASSSDANHGLEQNNMRMMLVWMAALALSAPAFARGGGGHSHSSGSHSSSHSSGANHSAKPTRATGVTRAVARSFATTSKGTSSRSTGGYTGSGGTGAGQAGTTDATAAEASGRSATSPTRLASARSTGGQTCYTGPRGGTYTLTASGRKNYSGC